MKNSEKASSSKLFGVIERVVCFTTLIYCAIWIIWMFLFFIFLISIAAGNEGYGGNFLLRWINFHRNHQMIFIILIAVSIWGLYLLKKGYRRGKQSSSIDYTKG